MSRTSPTGRLAAVLTAASSLAIAACSDTPAPVQPDAALVVTSPALSKAQADEQVVAGEVIVKLKDGSALDAVTARHGLAKGRSGYGNAYEILLTGRGNERAMAVRLAADPAVEFAEPNYLRQVDATTIDARLWAFRNPGGLNMKFENDPYGRDGQWLPSSYASKLDADEDNILNYASTGSAVTIGSIDTGVDWAHPEFTGRLIAGTDWLEKGTLPDDIAAEGHGTHTTGTMAGANVGVTGIAGAGAKVKVYVQRVCGTSGCPTTAIVNAIYEASNYIDAGGKRLVAVNLSLGGPSESTAEKNALIYAASKGVLVIASAGNSGAGRVSCPACDPNAISVSSTTWADQLAPYSQSGSGLDLSAPDGCIFSAVKAGWTEGRIEKGPITGASYGYMQGTSMAAPQVTGTAALVASMRNIRGTTLRDWLYSHTDDLGASGYDTKFGNGRINTYYAVTGNRLAAGQ